jgi:hypothetical protein
MECTVAFRYVRGVEFRSEDYTPDIARLLAVGGDGKRPMPLVKNSGVSTQACEDVKKLKAHSMGVLSGLYLYLGCWDAAHSAADSVEDPNGYYWHAIVHRQEPDAGNAGYWFRKTGTHPIFARLALEAANTGYLARREWDPFAFVEFCESARQRPESNEALLAMQVQLVEWQLLFDYCARGENC